MLGITLIDKSFTIAFQQHSQRIYDIFQKWRAEKSLHKMKGPYDVGYQSGRNIKINSPLICTYNKLLLKKSSD